MKSIQEIRTWEELEKLVSTELTVFVFKHSTQCPISSRALAEFHKFADKNPSCALAYIDVIANRSVSNAFAGHHHVIHESPQAILLAGGKVSWHKSHREITESNLEKAMRESEI